MSLLERKASRVLFVCLGNICRSPMAAALSLKLFGDRIVAESSGLNPVYDQATDEAIRVMSERGIDISEHQSRSVREVDLDGFDYIIAATPLIKTKLPAVKRPETIITWNVEDPYGGDLDVYRNCAKEIAAELKIFSELLDTRVID